MADKTVVRMETGVCARCGKSILRAEGAEGWTTGKPGGATCWETGYGPHLPREAGQTCEHSKQVDGRLVLVRYCGYCWAEYLEPKAHKAYFCSSTCRDRNNAWNRWVADSRVAAVGGDVNKRGKVGAVLPAAGVTLAAAVERFQLPFELLEAVA